jgi:hypothetical protein
MVNQLEISPEQFAEWRQHPVTQQVFRSLELQCQEQMLRWSQGEFHLKGRDFEAGILGRMAGYRAVIGIEHGDLQDE